MGESITLTETTIQPGERKTLRLSMPKLYDWTPLHIPNADEDANLCLPLYRDLVTCLFVKNRQNSSTIPPIFNEQPCPNLAANWGPSFASSSALGIFLIHVIQGKRYDNYKFTI